MKRISTIATTVLLLVGSLFVGVPSASAAVSEQNLAGRPINGNATNATGWCQGTAYGRVDGKMVLFTASHCWSPTSPGGEVVNGPNGVRIGVHAADVAGLRSHDFAYIKLDSGAYPSIKNRVYHGGSAPNDYWTITSKFGNASLNCTKTPSPTPTLYHPFQRSSTTIDIYRIGTLIGRYNGEPCALQTNLISHNSMTPGYKDSGSALITGPGVITGVATGQDGSNKLYFNAVNEAMVALNTYWKAHGTLAGAYFCVTSTCF